MKITEEHIKLLAGMAELLELETDSFGFVPQFNAKRPFGNSMRHIVAADVLEQLDEDRDDLDFDDEDRVSELIELLQECTPVLKAILGSPDMTDFVGMELDD